MDGPPGGGDAVRVAGIVGSLRTGSYTRRLVALALEGASEIGANTSLVDLRDYTLPYQDASDEVDAHPEVERLRADIRPCKGIILGTPEYHGSYSGVLKNALDLMGFEEFEGRMVGLVAVAGGGFGGLRALDELRSVGRAVHAWVVPEQAVVPRGHTQFDDAGNLKDERLAHRVREVGRQVGRFAYLHHARQWHEFLGEWERAVPNPGGAER